MSDYRKNLCHTVNRTSGYSLLKQVGRGLHGVLLSDDHVELISCCAAEVLNLGQVERRVDLCCGNGTITERIAPLVLRARGLDCSEGLSEAAGRNSSANNVEYVRGDVGSLGLNSLPGAKKMLLNEALRHFTENSLNPPLQNLPGLDKGALVYFGGIPDVGRVGLSYGTAENPAFYERREREGRPHSGSGGVGGRRPILRRSAGHGALFRQ